MILYIMHPALRTGPLFFTKTPLPPFHFLPTGLNSPKRLRVRPAVFIYTRSNKRLYSAITASHRAAATDAAARRSFANQTGSPLAGVLFSPRHDADTTVRRFRGVEIDGRGGFRCCLVSIRRRRSTGETLWSLEQTIWFIQAILRES